MQATKTLTLLEFDSDEDHARAQTLCRRLGYGSRHAYATSSDLPGLYCLPLRPTQPGLVICKSAEFGMVSVQTFEN